MGLKYRYDASLQIINLFVFTLFIIRPISDSEISPANAMILQGRKVDKAIYKIQVDEIILT